jgi:GNAT superfamily N-acetyltransferase
LLLETAAPRDDRRVVTVIEDIEDTLVAHWSQLGQWPRGELHDENGLLWFQTPIRHLPYNGIIRTRLGAGPAADETIAAVLKRFRDRDADCFWFVHPSATPHDLVDRLTAHALQAAEHIRCMSLELSGRSERASRGPADVAVREVLDERDARAYSDLTISYWEIPDSERPLVADLHRHWGRRSAPGRRFLAYAGGEPVGKAYLSLAGPRGVASIFGMSTVPHARRRGVATTLTAALLQAARDAGYQRAVLHSTSMAAPIYRRFGFAERCKLTIFATAPLWSDVHAHGSQAEPAPLMSRQATRNDVAALTPLMRAAIEQLQTEYLDEAQIAASHAIMGLDAQLIDDATYFVVECDGRLAGCGGWSRRATLYGGDHSAGRDSALLDPSSDPARIRAMYTHPDFSRRGVGRLILSLCESAAAADGFTRLELMATLAGAPLYTAAGFEAIERIEDASGGVPVPIIRMAKAIPRRDL